MKVYFLYIKVGLLLFQQVFSFDSTSARDVFKAYTRHDHNSSGNAGTPVSHKVLHHSSDSTTHISGKLLLTKKVKPLALQNYLKAVQERVYHLQTILDGLKAHSDSKLDQSEVVRLTVEADQSLNDLRQLNIKKLPSQLRSKIAILEQSVENIKTTISALKQNQETVNQLSILEHQVRGHGSRIYIKLLEDWTGSLESDLEKVQHNRTAQRDLLTIMKINAQMRTILIQIENFGSRNFPIPNRLKSKIEQLKRKVDSFINSLKHIESDNLTKNNTTTNPNKERDVSFEILQGWIKTLKHDLDYLHHNHTARKDQQNLVRIVNLIGYILIHMENIGFQNIPTHLKTEIKFLELRVNAMKKEMELIISTGKTENFIPSENPNNNEFTNNTKQGTKTTTGIDNEKYKQWITVLESNVNDVVDQLISRTDSTNLTLIYSELEKILNEVKQRNGQNKTSNDFDSKIIKIEKTVESYARVVKLMIEKEQRTNHEIRESRENIIKTTNEIVSSLEGVLEHLRTQIYTAQDFTEINSMADGILNELKTLQAGHTFPNQLHTRIVKLEENVKKLKNDLSNSSPPNSADVNNEVGKVLNTSIEEENTNITLEYVSSLEQSLEQLMHQLSFKSDKLTVIQTHAQVNEILSQLRKLLLEKMFSKSLETKIKDLLKRVVSFEKVVQDKKGSDEQNGIGENARIESIQIVKDYIHSLKYNLMRLESELVSKQDKFILTHLHLQVHEIFMKLKRLEETKVTLDLHKNVKQLIQIAINFMRKIESKITSMTIEHNSNDKTEPRMKYVKSALQHITNIENIIDEFDRPFYSEEGHLFILKSKRLECENILHSLKLMRKENMPGILLDEIENLKTRLTNVITKIDFKIHNKPATDGMDHNQNDKQFEIDLTNGKVNTITRKLMDIEKLLLQNLDIPALININYQVEIILTELQDSELKYLPVSLQSNINKLIQAAKNVQGNLMKSITEKKMSTQMENKNITVTNVQDIVQVITSRVSGLLNDLKYYKSQLDVEQDGIALNKILNEISDIMLEIKGLEVIGLPRDLQRQIEQLRYNAINLRDRFKEKELKMRMPTSTSYGDVHLEKMVQHRLTYLKTVLENFKHKLSMDQGQSRDYINLYFQVNVILAEVELLKVQNISESLRKDIEILQGDSEKLQRVAETMINTKILNPMTNFINDLLSQLEKLKRGSFFILTKAKIQVTEEDLKSLRDEIQSLTNYRLIMRMKYHLKKIVERLNDLKAFHLPRSINVIIKRFYKFIMFVIPVQSTGGGLEVGNKI